MHTENCNNNFHFRVRLFNFTCAHGLRDLNCTDGATMVKMANFSRPPFAIRLAAMFFVVTSCFCAGLYALIHFTEVERLNAEHRDAAQSIADSLSIVLRSPIVAMDVEFVAYYSEAVIANNQLLERVKVTIVDGKALFDSGNSHPVDPTTVYSEVLIGNNQVGRVALTFDGAEASLNAKATAQRYARTMCSAMLLLYATVAWFVHRQLVSPLESIVRQLENLKKAEHVLDSSLESESRAATSEVYRCVIAINNVNRKLVSRAHDAEKLSHQLQLQIKERNNAWRLTEDKSNQLADAVNELRLQQAELVEAGELKAQQEVIRRIAHDLNNMLTPAVIATDMLQSEYSGHSESEEELISLIHSALGDAAHLVSIMRPQQIGIAIDSDKLIMSTHSFTDVWKECGRLARMQESVRDEKAILVFHEDQMAIVDVRVQLASVRNAILNLVVNAFEQSVSTSIDTRSTTVECSWHPGPSYLQIDITDNCGGVSPDVLPLMWKLGVSNKEEKHKASRGMGLTNARSTARRHGGDLYLNQNDRTKTTFTIVLPVEGSTGNGELRPNGSGLTALVVDDEKDVRDSVTRLLDGCGVSVTAVGPEDLEQVKRNHYDIYLIDVRLGPVNGGDVVLNLRNSDPSAFYALMTAYDGDLTEQQLFQLRGVRVLSKPLTLAVLYNLLDSIPRRLAGNLSSPLKKATD